MVVQTPQQLANVNKANNKANSHSHKHLIIGAGFVGLGIAQALTAAGIPYDQVDASDDIGGNWHHGVYETAHIISSRKTTEFSYFPMPADYPDFPSAAQMLAYLRRFADHFGLRDQIECDRPVTQVYPIANNQWQVTFAHGDRRIYKGVILCNGHHWCKRLPKFTGQFNGEIIHSKDYKRPEQLRGKRVLVIGGGNSACDIAAEAARVAKSCTLSMRDTVWFIPKTFAGVPVAEFPQWWMPDWLQRGLIHIMIHLSFGSHRSYGLNPPNHRLLSKHPTINNEVPYYLKHGRITAKPEVKRLAGDTIHFVDGTEAEFDLVMCATGYHVAYPFLPLDLNRVTGPMVQCYGGSHLPDYKGLYFVGWGQTRGGVGPVMSAYGPFLARCIQLQDELAVPLGLVFKALGQPLPTTHLSDPHKTMLKLAIAQFGFPWIRYRAKQINNQYPHFHNQPIAMPIPGS
ncbi:MAG: NAD(P)-binding domain-containing protein [Cyanothece sp. SIO2G6]|nr:NAD(P)-binding domain-containing protein [Cyanothece sp. SIO2G6]